MCKGCTRRTAWLLLLLVIARLSWASPGRFVIAEATVNGVTQRPVMISVAAGGAILVKRDDLTSWNLDVQAAPVELLQGIAHVRLDTLPGVEARLEGMTLTIVAAGSAFQGTRVDLQKTSVPVIDAGRGAYLNYDLSTFAGRGQRPLVAASLEGIVFADALSLASNGVFSDNGTVRQYVRYETSLHWDLADQVRSLVAGDAISRSGSIARGFRFGGISYGTNFAIRPDLVTFALPAVPGESRIPTSADLLINGQAHSRLDLAAGPFEISNVPAINGAGEIQLVTRDPLGRQQVLVVPYYITPALLRPGLTDAGFEIGKVREDFGLENFRYGRGFARGLLRRGVTPGLTLEGFAETSGGQRVAGAGLTAMAGTFAVVGLAGAMSEGDRRGHTLSASLERSSRGLSFGVRGQYSSRDFSQIGEVAGLHYRLNANAGVSLGKWGNMNVVYAADARYDRGRIDTMAVSYQKQIGRMASLLANFSTTRSDEGVRHFAGLALTMPLDPVTSASLSSTRQNGRGEQVLDVRQNLPIDEGWAARARATAAPARASRVDAGVTWQNEYGQVVADVSQSRGGGNVRLGMNGSLVMAGGVTRAVRQLGDAFAIVSVPGYAGIDVYHDNQRVARTDAAGFAVVPRLRPYESNSINLDTLKLSLTTELKAPRRHVTPARRSGVLLQFKAATTHGALVRVLQANGEPVPAGATLSLRGEMFPVAANGEAWVTGLDAASDASVAWRDQRCAVRIPMADGAQARPRIGPLTCKAGSP
ncbi:MAG: fimbria/pilus outer membrane usher protein [Betaproteobacteria bacterium]